MEVLRQVLSVLLVFGLLALAIWKFRRGSAQSLWPRFRGNRILETVERLALTPQHSLHVVRVHGREVVISTHPQGCSVLLQVSGKADA